MRLVLMLMAILIGGGILGLPSRPAAAGPTPAVSSPVVVPALVIEAGWRRNWRRYGPDVVIPDVDVDVAPDVDVDVTAPAVITENPPIIAIVPVRPVSCGEFRYWDGERCVDARYNNPYLGPR
ncbi:MAG TPA: hypothetical protein VGA46_03325 [Methyloceanibacter sp.]|jgi:hypothetical protein